MTGPLTFTLPTLPPSTNALFGYGKNGRRYKLPHYSKWQFDAGLLINSQRKKNERIEGPYGLQIQFIRNGSRRRDLDNMLKSIIDLFVSIGVTSDDSDLQTLEASWIKPAEPVDFAMMAVILPCGVRG